MPRRLEYAEFYNRTERQADGCLLWTGPVGGGGTHGRYGLWGRQQYAHREAYERVYGPVPEGMYVCHSCDTTLCVEPGHLRVATPAENQRDATDRRRKPGLTREQVEEVRRTPRTYGSLIGLAEKFGVTPNTIYLTRKGLDN